MVKPLPGEWQPTDRAAYDALPGAIQDILKGGRLAREMEADLKFALSFYPDAKAKEFTFKIFRCLGLRPSED